MDFPQDFGNIVTPTHLNTFMNVMGVMGARRIVGGMGAPASAAWPAGSQAIYMPFTLPWPYIVRRAFWHNGSALGNMDIGIYTTDGAQMWHSGSVGQSGASVLQYTTLATELLLRPGDYLLGLSNDGTTNRVFGVTSVTAVLGRLIGLYQQASAFALPANATLAQWNSAIWPICGLTRTASGF